MRAALQFALYGAIGGLLVGLGVLVFRHLTAEEREPAPLWQIAQLDFNYYGAPAPAAGPGGNSANYMGSAARGRGNSTPEADHAAESPTPRERRDETLLEVAVHQASLKELTEAYKTIDQMADDRSKANALENIAYNLLSEGLNGGWVDGPRGVENDQIVRMVAEIKKIGSPAERSRALATLLVYVGEYAGRRTGGDFQPVQPPVPAPEATPPAPAAIDLSPSAQTQFHADAIPLTLVAAAPPAANGDGAEGTLLHAEGAKSLVRDVTKEEIAGLTSPIDRARVYIAASKALGEMGDREGSRSALKNAADEARQAPTSEWSIWRIWTWPIALAALGSLLFGLLGHAFHALFHGLTVGVGETIYHEVTRRVSTPAH